MDHATPHLCTTASATLSSAASRIPPNMRHMAGRLMELKEQSDSGCTSSPGGNACNDIVALQSRPRTAAAWPCDAQELGGKDRGVDEFISCDVSEEVITPATRAACARFERRTECCPMARLAGAPPWLHLSAVRCTAQHRCISIAKFDPLPHLSHFTACWTPCKKKSDATWAATISLAVHTSGHRVYRRAPNARTL